MFKLEALKARKGDCLMLHHGSEAAPRLVIVDGGPSRVYGPHLKPRLEALRDAQPGSAPTGALKVDMLMISHIDDDHIKGILDLTKQTIADKAAHRPPLLEVATLWHNTFNDIIGDSPEELEAAVTKATTMLASRDAPAAALAISGDAALILASVNQGRRLRDEAEVLGWPINRPFDRLVMADPGGSSDHTVSDELVLRVIGPMKPEIVALQERHDAFLRERGLGREDPEAALAAFADNSVPNLSSIVVLAECAGRTMLLTGDARGDKILKGLRMRGFLREGGALDLDLLKVPHHGSDRNVTTGFFAALPARHYVFSCDGEHGNPERATLKMLFQARPEGGFVLHFTYEIDEIDRRREETAHGAWDAERDSLAALLEQKRAAGLDFAVSTPGGAHGVEIDLS